MRSRSLALLALIAVLAAAIALVPRESDDRSERLPAAANGRIDRLEPHADGTWSIVFLADVQGGPTYLPGILAEAEALGASAVVLGGDISRGVDHLHLATRWLRDYPAGRLPVFAVAGNHDVGTEAARQAFERAFGSTGFEFRIGRTRVLGLDGTRPEAELERLRERLDATRAAGERLLLVRHFPVLKGAPGAPNPQILDAIRGYDVPVVLTGHGHHPSLDVVGATQFVVAPAAGDRNEGQGQAPVSYLVVRWTGSEYRVERHDRARSNWLDLRSEIDHLWLGHLLPLARLAPVGRS